MFCKQFFVFSKIFSYYQLCQVVYSWLNHLMQLVTQEYFIEFSRHEIFKLTVLLSCLCPPPSSCNVRPERRGTFVIGEHFCTMCCNLAASCCKSLHSKTNLDCVFSNFAKVSDSNTLHEIWFSVVLSAHVTGPAWFPPCLLL